MYKKKDHEKCHYISVLGVLKKSALKARLLCVVPVITVDIVIHAHVNFNRGWLDRVFLNCGWLDRGGGPAQTFQSKFLF